MSTGELQSAVIPTHTAGLERPCVESDNIVGEPLRLCSQSGKQWAEIEAVPNDAVPWTSARTVPGQPAMVAYRRGLGPAELAARIGSNLAVHVSARGLSDSDLVELAESIPLIGDPDRFAAPDDAPLSVRGRVDEFAMLLGVSPTLCTIRAHEDLEGSAGDVDFDVHDGDSWQYLFCGNATANPLREATAHCSHPRFVDAPIPMVAGERQPFYAQVMWIQRDRFWHFFSNDALDKTISMAQAIADRIGGRV